MRIKKNGILGYHFFLVKLMQAFHFYTIDNDFISDLKTIDSRIQDNYNGKRPYLGIILEINGLNYFAPLSSYKPKQDKINNLSVFKIYEKGNPNNKLGVVHINNMFPVPTDKLTPVVFDLNDKYGRMMQNQYEYILHNQENIKKQALTLYNLVVNNRSSFFAKISCDFIILEKHIHDIICKKNATQTVSSV